MELRDVLGDLYSDEIKSKLEGHRMFIFKDGDDIKLDGRQFVPIDRFAEVNQKAKDAQAQLDKLNGELEELGKKAGASEELQQKIKDLSAQNEQMKTESGKNLARIRKESALRLQLLKDGAKDDVILLPLFDLEKIEVDDKGALKFYEDQLKAVKERTPWAFGEIQVRGTPPAHSNGPSPPEFDKNPWSKESFNLTKQGEILKKDPDLAKKMQNSAK